MPSFLILDDQGHKAHNPKTGKNCEMFPSLVVATDKPEAAAEARLVRVTCLLELCKQTCYFQILMTESESSENF